MRSYRAPSITCTCEDRARSRPRNCVWSLGRAIHRGRLPRQPSARVKIALRPCPRARLPSDRAPPSTRTVLSRLTRLPARRSSPSVTIATPRSASFACFSPPTSPRPARMSCSSSSFRKKLRSTVSPLPFLSLARGGQSPQAQAPAIPDRLRLRGSAGSWRRALGARFGARPRLLRRRGARRRDPDRRDDRDRARALRQRLRRGRILDLLPPLATTLERLPVELDEATTAGRRARPARRR